MQTFSFELIRHISQMVPVKVIAWGGSQLFLPWFFIKGLFLGIYYLKTYKIKTLHLGDAVLAPLGLLVRLFCDVRLAVTVHGRDIVFPLRVYQFFVPRFLCGFDYIFSVSQHTKEELVKRGVPEEKVRVIPNGIGEPEPVPEPLNAWKEEFFRRRVGVDVKGKKILLTVGRLVARKGHAFFLESVLSELIKTEPDVIYCIVGDGRERGRLENIIESLGLGDYVYLLGSVSQEELNRLYLISDLFVMPNISVEGDLEGFGIVALEASIRKLPVIASNLEGIRDAIHHDKNGYLTPPGSGKEFLNVITGLLSDMSALREDGKMFGKYTAENFLWSGVASTYLSVLGSNEITRMANHK